MNQFNLAFQFLIFGFVTRRLSAVEPKIQARIPIFEDTEEAGADTNDSASEKAYSFSSSLSSSLLDQ